MKKFLFLAAALLAAAACSREQLIPEESEIVEKGPVKVTLTVSNPETRTELYDGLPYWSAGDQLGVTRLWNDYYANYFPIADGENYLFSMDTPTTNPISTASFTGSVISPKDGGTDLYVAYYPYVPESDYHVVWYTYFDDNGTRYYYQGLDFEIPHVQYPTPTSFDKSADFMVSESFSIDPEEYYDNEIVTRNNLKFTRMNAIVKIVLVDKTTDKRYEGKNVYGVTLGEVPAIIESSAPESMTRVSIENGTGVQALTGWTYYDPCWGAWNNRDPYSFYNRTGCFYPYVKAIYEDDTVYSIGDENAATYVVVFPSVLKEGGDGLLVTIDFEQGLHIARRVVLPADIALQPSRMTTLNIGLYDWYDPDYGCQMSGVSPVSFSLTDHQESTDWIKLCLDYRLADGDPYEDTPIGVLYGTNKADVMAGIGQRVQVASGNGSVELTISGLEPTTTYYFRPYALIGGHYAYSDLAYDLNTAQ